jgi:peptidoglycan/LPS O-acetylase OafA/YrhL
MLHPMLKIVASRPELLAEHLAAYGQLVAVQAQTAAGQLRRRALLGTVAALAAALGVGLAGVALLLVAAVPLQAMPLPWLLLVVPLVPLVLAAGCAMQLRGQGEVSTLDPLREQFAADTALLREASGS